MPDTHPTYKHRRLGGLAILVMITLVSVHPVYGSLSYSKSPISKFAILTQSGPNSGPSTSTSLMTLQAFSTTDNDKNSTIKIIASKAVITCVNSTIKNALIDALINRPLVNVNGSIRIDPTFVNHTMTDIMGCINKIENEAKHT
jgi:hypothetical protein